MHQLRLFVVLAEELHFGRAARRLFMTQPALSQQIRALEKRLGVSLVDRTSRTVALTAAGEALLPESRAVIEAMDRLRESAAEQASDTLGRLRVGAIGAEAAMPYTRAILGEVRRRHPRMTVDMRAVDFVRQVTALVEGEIDAAFLRSPIPPGFQSMHLADEPRVVCMPAGDPLAAAGPLRLAQLADHLVVDVPPGVPRMWWDDWVVNPRPDGRPVRFGPAASDVEATLLLVADGQGIAFFPAAARALYPRPGVAYRDVVDLPHSSAELVWLTEYRARPAVAALREAARVVLARQSSA